MNQIMSEVVWTDIAYREFWDIPRAILARCGSCWFFFNSRFDDDIDEYIDHYEVWRLPLISEDQRNGSWLLFPGIALEKMPNIELNSLPFKMKLRGRGTVEAPNTHL